MVNWSVLHGALVIGLLFASIPDGSLASRDDDEEEKGTSVSVLPDGHTHAHHVVQAAIRRMTASGASSSSPSLSSLADVSSSSAPAAGATPELSPLASREAAGGSEEREEATSPPEGEEEEEHEEAGHEEKGHAAEKEKTEEEGKHGHAGTETGHGKQGHAAEKEKTEEVDLDTEPPDCEEMHKKKSKVLSMFKTKNDLQRRIDRAAELCKEIQKALQAARKARDAEEKLVDSSAELQSRRHDAQEQVGMYEGMMKNEKEAIAEKVEWLKKHGIEKPAS